MYEKPRQLTHFLSGFLLGRQEDKGMRTSLRKRLEQDEDLGDEEDYTHTPAHASSVQMGGQVESQGQDALLLQQVARESNRETGLGIVDNAQEIALAQQGTQGEDNVLYNAPPPLPPLGPGVGGTAADSSRPATATNPHSPQGVVIRETSKVVSPPAQTNDGHEEYDPGAMLLPRDLKGNGTLPVPVNATQVYERNVTLGKKNLSAIRKVVRYGIFPLYKFVIFENDNDRRETWDYVRNFKEKVGRNISGDVVKALGLLDKGEMVCAVYWNTYKGDVLKTLSQTRSTIMSNMKRSIVPGKILFIESYYYCGMELLI